MPMPKQVSDATGYIHKILKSIVQILCITLLLLCKVRLQVLYMYDVYIQKYKTILQKITTMLTAEICLISFSNETVSIFRNAYI